MLRSTPLRLALCLALLTATRLFAGEMPVVKPAEVGMSAAQLAKVDDVLKKMIDDKKIAGGIVVVARHGKVAHVGVFGKMDIEADKPMQEDTIVRLYSMTKAITTAAALTLVDEGKLNPSDPVSKYIPAFADLKVATPDGLVAPARPMTVADLMRHTAGLTYGSGSEPVAQGYKSLEPMKSHDLAEMADKLAKIPLEYHPGQKWIYSVAIDVLGRVCEVASGQPLDAFLAARIFKPLDMKDTGFHVPPDKLDRFAANYSGDLKLIDDPQKSKYSKPATFFSGGGGLVGTARDYVRFLQMVENDGELEGVRVLKPGTVKLMKHDQLPREAFPISFGAQVRHGVGFSFGFSVRTKNTEWDPAGREGEFGWGGAASTHYWVSPKDDLIVVTLEQRMPYNFETEFAVKKLIYDAVEK